MQAYHQGHAISDAYNTMICCHTVLLHWCKAPQSKPVTESLKGFIQGHALRTCRQAACLALFLFHDQPLSRASRAAADCSKNASVAIAKGEHPRIAWEASIHHRRPSCHEGLQEAYVRS